MLPLAHPLPPGWSSLAGVMKRPLAMRRKKMHPCRSLAENRTSARPWAVLLALFKFCNSSSSIVTGQKMRQTIEALADAAQVMCRNGDKQDNCSKLSKRITTWVCTSNFHAFGHHSETALGQACCATVCADAKQCSEDPCWVVFAQSAHLGSSIPAVSNH